MAKKLKQFRIGVLASGSGSNFEHLVKACESRKLYSETVILITDREGTQAVERARRLHVPALTLIPKTYSSFAAWDHAVAYELKKAKVDLVFLLGFLRLIGPDVLSSFKFKILNSHPSLLPKYGGKGMYGLKVHEAVLKANEKITGVSIHLVSDKYDEGKVLAQNQVDVLPSDNAEALEDRVKGAESKFLIQFMNDLETGKICLPESN